MIFKQNVTIKTFEKSDITLSSLASKAHNQEWWIQKQIFFLFNQMKKFNRLILKIRVTNAESTSRVLTYLREEIFIMLKNWLNFWIGLEWRILIDFQLIWLDTTIHKLEVLTWSRIMVSYKFLIRNLQRGWRKLRTLWF